MESECPDYWPRLRPFFDVDLWRRRWLAQAVWRQGESISTGQPISGNPLVFYTYLCAYAVLLITTRRGRNEHCPHSSLRHPPTHTQHSSLRNNILTFLLPSQSTCCHEVPTCPAPASPPLPPPPSDVAAIPPPQAPALHHPAATQPSEYCPRAAPSPADKVDSKPRTIAATVKSRAHSRLASLGRIRPRGGQQPAERQHQQLPEQQQPYTPVTEPPRPAETYPIEPTPSVSSSHKRSEPSTASYHSSETTLTDEKFHDPKSFDEQRPQYIPRDPQRNASADRRGGSEDRIDPKEEYHRLLETRPRMMHQTSSRLLRMTEDDRPFTKDFKDLFSTLMVSLPLTSHRVRFSRFEHTFTTDEAITNLGSLKFSQSNRMPDPKDPTRIVTTTTTTTFSMAKEMARSVCQRFFDARFVESCEGKTDFMSKSSVWQLTPKGMHVLARFCQRNGIHQRHVNDLLDSPRNMMQLVILERETETDKVNSDDATVSILFRRFAGDTGPNLKTHSSSSDSDSLNEYATGLVGVKMQRARRVEKDAPYYFNGKTGYDWLMNCCTVVDKREVYELASLFLIHGLIEPYTDDRTPPPNPNQTPRYNPSKNTQYAVTQKGMRAAGWITSANGTVDNGATSQQRIPNGVSRDSNTNRMTVIIRDPALRLLFREYLRETHCEENLSFYVDVQAFLADYEHAKKTGPSPRLDVIRETLASAYSLYNAFLAPGSPCELNIDHNLRNALAGRMTRAVGEDEQMVRSLDEVATLFDQAQSSVFKLMASDSVPKFSREPKYAQVLKERNLEGMINQFAASNLD
ncbi:hypothetical protein Q7P37_009070 [Cladosporium fusiforme]